jgi:DNA-binding NtrC family response regulator
MKKHILLVDDDIDELKIFMDALEEVPGSYKCTYAPNADQAVSMLKYIHPHYIFIDYNLPGMNGIDLLAEVKKDRGLQEVPVYLYSTTINTETKRLAAFLGAAGSIEKPSSVGMMRSVLRNVLVTSNVGMAS